jgi:hypothetical protein
MHSNEVNKTAKIAWQRIKGIYVIMVAFSDSVSFFTFSLLLHLDKMQTSFDLFKI